MEIKDAFGRHYPLSSVLRGVNSGWSHLVCRLIRDLEKLGWDGELHQIKEKFGGLRFYIGGGTDEIHSRIADAENESYKTCEMCGESGGCKEIGGWTTTLCEGCYAKEVPSSGEEG